MARKRYKPEEIVAKLRQVDVLVSQGQNMVDAIRQIGVGEVTYYRWRQEFGGLKTEQVKRLKDPAGRSRSHPVRQRTGFRRRGRAGIDRGCRCQDRLDQIERGSPWENGYIESFNARFRDDLLNGEIFYTLREAQMVIEQAPHLNRIQATSNISAAAYALRRWHPADDTARLLQVLHERKCQHRDGGRTRPRSERGLPERGAVTAHRPGSVP